MIERRRQQRVVAKTSSPDEAESVAVLARAWASVNRRPHETRRFKVEHWNYRRESLSLYLRAMSHRCDEAVPNGEAGPRLPLAFGAGSLLGVRQGLPVSVRLTGGILVPPSSA